MAPVFILTRLFLAFPHLGRQMAYRNLTYICISVGMVSRWLSVCQPCPPQYIQNGNRGWPRKNYKRERERMKCQRMIGFQHKEEISFSKSHILLFCKLIWFPLGVNKWEETLKKRNNKKVSCSYLEVLVGKDGEKRKVSFISKIGRENGDRKLY